MVVVKPMDLPVAMNVGGVVAREKEAGPYNVGFESYPKGDYSRFFKGLPNGQCHAEHHGVVVKGKLRYRYSKDRYDDIGPGQAYVASPGHTFEVLEDGTEIVEFSPRGEEFDRTMEVVGKNLEKWAAEQKGRP